MNPITIDQINALPPVGDGTSWDYCWPTIRETEGEERAAGKYRISDGAGTALPEYAETEEEAVELALAWAEDCHVATRHEVEEIYRKCDRAAAWDLDVNPLE